VIEGVVRSYPRPPVYIEIGVATCECFNTVAPYCRKAHAVDPSSHALTHVNDAVHHNARRWEMTSDQFFHEYVGSPDVIFIDGDHHYDVAQRDFENAAKILMPGGTILLHDVWPGSRIDARPEACGDVYRLVDEIRQAGLGATDAGWVGSPEWDTYLYPTFPGLLVCQRRVRIPEWP
jgi:hypothetical protein